MNGLLRQEPIPISARPHWAEFVAEELYQAEVQVKPRPAEFDISRVARDPRIGTLTKDYGPPYSRLCKEVGVGDEQQWIPELQDFVVYNLGQKETD